jgi:predicted SprT family Zn-dependent metalloprotease
MNFSPLPYHQAVASHLEAKEADLWAWFLKDESDEQARKARRLELLKGAVELDVKGLNGRRQALASIAKGRLQLSAPVRLFQSHDTAGGPNAYLLFDRAEILIMFQGRILELLTEPELLDLLGHEMSHYKLYVEQGGRFHAAQRLLAWIGTQPGCPATYLETARRLSLYTEIYCDIGGLTACEDRNATISSLVKTIADFKDIDAATYLRQAEEIMALGGAAGSAGASHPELHIRVLALANSQSMAAGEFHALLKGMIDGRLSLGSLDLFEQTQLRAATDLLIDRVAAGPGVATAKFLTHVREFRPGYKPPAAPSADTHLGLPPLDANAQMYLGFILMDLATADPDNMQAAWPTVVGTAEFFALDGTLRNIARDEFKGRRKLLKQIEARAA